MRPIEEGGLKTLSLRLGNDELVNYDSSKPPPENVTVTESHGTMKMTHKFTIPGGGSAEMIASYVDYYHLPISDVIFAKYPTQELEILVRYPEDLVFNLNSFATTPCEPFHQEAGRIDYRFKGALLPGQGVAYLMNSKNGHDNEEVSL